MNNTLEEQLKSHLGDIPIPPVWLDFLNIVSKSYDQYEAVGRKFDNFLDKLPIGYFRSTPGDGVFLDANPACIRMLDLDSKEEIFKHRALELYQYPEQRKVWGEKLRKDGFMTDFELPLISFKGRKIWFSMTAFLNKAETGEVFFEGLVEDITERKNLEVQFAKERENIEQEVENRTHELNYEKAKLDEVAKHMDVGAILLGADGKVSFVNAAGMKLLSLNASDDPMDAFFQAFTTLPVKDYIIKSFAGESAEVPEVEALGKSFWLSFISLKSEGNVFGVLIWLRDITPQKMLERAKGQFLAIASHEMRTPLSIIRGNAELLLEDTDVQKNLEVQTQIQSVLKSSVRLLGIVNDFLNVQNVEEGHIALVITSLDIVRVIGDTLTDLQEIATKKGISLTFQQPETAIAPIMIDKFRLQQILINLISNGIHYTQKGGVTVSVENGADDTIVVHVADTGVGIDPEDQTRLFKKFQIGKIFMRSREFGSGLGLYISSMLAHLLGGGLALERSEVGVGSVFRLTLPRSVSQKPQGN